MSDVVDQMLANRRLERVAGNLEHAVSVIETAERHVVAARTLAATVDHAMAFIAAYDGARKALAAGFSTPGDMRGRLNSLVLAGTKTGTSSLLCNTKSNECAAR